MAISAEDCPAGMVTLRGTLLRWVPSKAVPSRSSETLSGEAVAPSRITRTRAACPVVRALASITARRTEGSSLTLRATGLPATS